jgi:hypothetical protein
MGTVAKSYLRKGFLIYEEMPKYLFIWLCNRSLLDLLIFCFLFYQCSSSATLPPLRNWILRALILFLALTKPFQ